MTGIDDREYHKAAPVPATGRPSIYSFRRPVGSDDLDRFFDEWLHLPRHGRVLDAGCGPGAYVPAASERCAVLVALDIAHGRLEGVTGATRVCGDVQTLPFPDGSFDAILAMHMLYHVPDIPLGVRELRRVLRDGGVLYAFTNSERAQWELNELYLRHGGRDASVFGDARFSNESGGPLLQTGFDEVTLVELSPPTWLEVPDVECIVDELQRLRYTLEPGLRSDVAWDDMISAARRDAQTVIDREGAFRMTENHGLFTCR
jgi:SAM-dependent methyltransferase